MKIKTQDLTGPALAWAVATLSGYTNLHRRELRGYEHPTTVLAMDACNGWAEFSSLYLDWERCGPIIEREAISIRPIGNRTWEAEEWSRDGCQTFAEGPNPLVAAMRCYVASKMGDEVEVPEELQ
jgi:hypothetical protein